MGKPVAGMKVRVPSRVKPYTLDECELVATTHVMDEYHRDCLMWVLSKITELEYSKAGSFKGEIRDIRARLEDIWVEVNRGKARSAAGEHTERGDTRGGAAGCVSVVGGGSEGAEHEARGDDAEVVRGSGDGGGEEGDGGGF